MSADSFYLRRDDRTRRYAGRTLDRTRRALVAVDPSYGSDFEGQVAVVVLANLLARMSPSVSVRVDDVPCVLPGREAKSLAAVVQETMWGADPFGEFEVASRARGDWEIQVGPTGERAVYGRGWAGWYGSGRAPLLGGHGGGANPFGASMAAIAAGADLFIRNFDAAVPIVSTLVDCFGWTSAPDWGAPRLEREAALGNMWVVGCGSVGTATLFFTTLWTRNFASTLFDGDGVERENLDRSPIFLAIHEGKLKVLATKSFLVEVGVREVVAEDKWLHESPRWANRRNGVPDVLVSAANEHGVRYQIEAGFPPIQIYGTTGKNWQSSMVRHRPFGEACSLCLFPEEATSSDPTACATGSVSRGEHDRPVDAALPFLSFGAGLMAAAELAKTTIAGYPFTPNCVAWYSKTGGVVGGELPTVPGCLCQTRDREIHRAMLRP